MTTALIRAEIGLRSAAARAQRIFRDERGEVNIVATVLLIVVAVALVVIFRDRMKTLLGSIFDSIDGKVTGV